MSAWAEWKHGMMSEDEYIRICNEEARLEELRELNGDIDEDEDEEVFIDDEIDEF